MKRILLFSMFPAINSIGGVEKVLFSMANKLIKFGYGVSIAVYDGRKGEIAFPVDKSVILHDLAAKQGHKFKLSLIQRLMRAFKGGKEARHSYEDKLEGEYLAIELKDIIENEEIDLAISFNIFGAEILYKYVGFSKPIISMQHGEPKNVLDKITNDSIAALNHCVINQVLFESYIDKNVEVTGISRNKYIHIPNPVEQFKIAACSKKNTIVSVATVYEVKQQHLLINAFNLIKDKYPEWNIEFWGRTDGNYGYYLKCNNLIEKYGLKDRIRFMGTTTNIGEVLSYAKIIVLVSCSEAFPLAISEGMSAGLVGIGLKSCSGVNELVEDGINGFLCDNTPESVADRLDMLMGNEDLLSRMGIQAHESMKKYSPDLVWERWKKLIDTVLLN